MKSREAVIIGLSAAAAGNVGMVVGAVAVEVQAALLPSVADCRPHVRQAAYTPNAQVLRDCATFVVTSKQDATVVPDADSFNRLVREREQTVRLAKQQQERLSGGQWFVVGGLGALGILGLRRSGRVAPS